MDPLAKRWTGAAPILPDGPGAKPVRGPPPLLLSRGMSQEPTSTFHVRTEDRPGAVVIVADGELDLVGAPRLLEAMPREGTAPVVLDLGAVGFMDSSGLRSLLEVRQACADAGRSFAIARPSDAVLRVLELVDLSREFEVVEPPALS